LFDIAREKATDLQLTAKAEILLESLKGFLTPKEKDR
jgi:hypothetical protein